MDESFGLMPGAERTGHSPDRSFPEEKRRLTAIINPKPGRTKKNQAPAGERAENREPGRIAFFAGHSRPGPGLSGKQRFSLLIWTMSVNWQRNTGKLACKGSLSLHLLLAADFYIIPLQPVLSSFQFKEYRSMARGR